MRQDRYFDTVGHAWPITGHWCQSCGLPLIKATLDQTTHPGCGEVV